MTTILAIHTSNGLLGRCDARCYEAIHPACTCICGGRNHGKGRQAATEQTRQLAQQWIASYTQRQGIASFTTHIHAEYLQATLWGAS